MKPILAVGAANAERVVALPSLSPGHKHTAPPGLQSAGGSAVNHSCRLLASGRPALPLAPIGDDECGRRVREVLLAAARAGGGASGADALARWLDDVVQPGESTSDTTVLVEDGGRRTVVCETGTAAARFADVCERVLERVGPDDVAGVLIGHIHADEAGEGRTSRGVIDRFAGRTPVLANFGRSQFGLGASRWLDALARIDLFQLTHAEALEFVADRADPPRTLTELGRWFRSHGIAAVLTLDRFGAIGVERESDAIALAWPYDLGPLTVDTTGAGDALAAGLIAELSRETAPDPPDLAAALERARTWAAYACTTPGGAHDCPTADDLRRFEGEMRVFAPVERTTFDASDAVLSRLDRAVRERS